MRGRQQGVWTERRRELTTTQVAKLVSTGRSWVSDWRGKVPAKVNCHHGARLCALKDVIARCIGLAPVSLRGKRFLAYAGNRLRNLGGEPNGIATPRQVGARNDKRAWCWLKEAATKSWRRDLQMRVSSLFLAPVVETSPDFSYRLVFAAGQRTGWLGLMNKTTISTHGAFSAMRVPVGGGR